MSKDKSMQVYRDINKAFMAVSLIIVIGVTIVFNSLDLRINQLSNEVHKTDSVAYIALDLINEYKQLSEMFIIVDDTVTMDYTEYKLRVYYNGELEVIEGDKVKLVYPELRNSEPQPVYNNVMYNALWDFMYE